MAQAYKCDRCKEYRDGSPKAGVVFHVDSEEDCDRNRSFVGNITSSLCESCAEDVHKLLTTKPTKPA
jgi:hypothetical protein